MESRKVMAEPLETRGELKLRPPVPSTFMRNAAEC